MGSTSSKKRFAGNGGFDSLLNVKPADEARNSEILPERPEPAPSKKIPLIRTTYVLRKDLLEKFRAIAYWDRKPIKDLMAKAMEDLVSRYEQENGDVKPIPRS